MAGSARSPSFGGAPLGIAVHPRLADHYSDHGFLSRFHFRSRRAEPKPPVYRQLHLRAKLYERVSLFVRAPGRGWHPHLAAICAIGADAAETFHSQYRIARGYIELPAVPLRQQPSVPGDTDQAERPPRVPL